MKKKILVVAGLLAMSGALTAQSVYPGQHAGKLKRETVAPMKVKSFDLKDVRLLPSRFRENMMRDSMMVELIMGLIRWVPMCVSLICLLDGKNSVHLSILVVYIVLHLYI